MFVLKRFTFDKESLIWAYNFFSFLYNYLEYPWIVDLKADGRKINFKMDTSANKTVIPDQIYNSVILLNLQKQREQIFNLLEVLGIMNIIPQKG